MQTVTVVSKNILFGPTNPDLPYYIYVAGVLVVVGMCYLPLIYFI